MIVKLAQGEAVALRLKTDCLRAAIKQPNLCEVPEIESRRVILRGLREGTTHLTLWLQNGAGARSDSNAVDSGPRWSARRPGRVADWRARASERNRSAIGECADDRSRARRAASHSGPPGLGPPGLDSEERAALVATGSQRETAKKRRANSGRELALFRIRA